MLAEPALGDTSQPRMVAATAAWEASDHTPGRLLHSSVMCPTLALSRLPRWSVLPDKRSAGLRASDRTYIEGHVRV